MKKTHTIRSKLITFYAGMTFLFIVTVFAATFLIYQTNIRSNSESLLEDTSTQVLNNYNSYFESVISFSNSIQSKLDTEDANTQSSKSEVSDYFDEVTKIKVEVNNIGLYSTDGAIIASTSDYEATPSPSTETWFQGAIQNKLINVFSRIEKSEDTYYILLSKYVSYNRGAGYAVLKAEFDFTKVIENMSQIDLGTGGQVTVYDKSYDLVYSSTSSDSDIIQEMNLLKTFVVGHAAVNMNGHSFFVYANTISNTSWRIAIFANTDYINTMTNTFLTTISLISLVLFIIAIILIIGISNSISRPIKQLQKEMDQVEKADYINYNAVAIKGSQETEDLARNFNTMMAKLKDLLQKYMDEQNEKRKSELKALQNQINPHFLYNTLDSIIYLIDTNDNKSAHDMVVALAKFFRISISKGQTIIPVENEVEHARNYLIIQKMRYKEMFSFSIQVDPECYKYNVIKLILQPIVENSITHGIKNKTDPGIIRIKGEIKDGFLIFSIFDNGFGILPEKIQAIYNSFNDPNCYQGVGLKNVYQRLTICYGSKADVRIFSELDEGTTVQLIIPLEGVETFNEDQN